MVTLVNRVKVSTSTTGTGDIILSSALVGFQSFAAGGVGDGQTVRYTIEEGADWEIGLGVYSASPPSLTRVVSESSNAGAALDLQGNAAVFVTAAAEDILQPANNLADLDDAGAARTNLGLGTAAVADATDFAPAVHTHTFTTTNISDIDNTNRSDGSVLVYNGTTSKYVATNSIENDNTVIKGGNY